MTILFRACIKATKILDVDETQNKGFSGTLLNNLEGEGMTSLRSYSAPSSTKENDFILLRFEIDKYDKIEDIHTILEDYKPVYCFNDICPRANIQCPAFSR